jgi:hypothetical protein
MTGYVQRISEMPGAWSWMSTVSFTRWGLQALMRSTYNNDSQEAYLETFSFHDESIGKVSSLYCCAFVPYVVPLIIKSCLQLIIQGHVFSWLAVWLGIFQGIVLLSLSPPLFGMKVEPSSSGSKRRRASTIAAQAQVQNEIKAQTSILSPLRGETSAAGIAQPFSSAFMIASPTSTLCDISLASPKDAVTIDQLETAVAANSNSNSNSISSSIPRDGKFLSDFCSPFQEHLFHSIFTR